MKKIIALFLIFIFTSNTFGNVCLYWGLKKIYKSRMHSEIESGNYKHGHEEIIVSKKDFVSGKIVRVDEKEIKYSGKMYDIVNEYFDGNNYHFICISDEDEDELDEAYNKNENKRTKDSLKHLLKTFLPFAVINETKINTPKLIPENYSCRIILPGLNISPDVLTPPPDISVNARF